LKENIRVRRVERELQHVVSQYILRYLTPHLPGLVSLSRVETTRELKHAKLFYTAMGSEEQKDQCAEVLKKDLPHLQRYLGRELALRNTPKVKFVVDEGFEHMMKIESLLRDIEQKRQLDLN
jgi:ribosome-binding factor A